MVNAIQALTAPDSRLPTPDFRLPTLAIFPYLCHYADKTP